MFRTHRTVIATAQLQVDASVRLSASTSESLARLLASANFYKRLRCPVAGNGSGKIASRGLQRRRDEDDPETIYVLDPDGLAIQIEPMQYKTRLLTMSGAPTN